MPANRVMKHWIAPLICLGCIALAGGCGSGNADVGGQKGLATVEDRLGSRQFRLEIADTEPKRETGLMYRTSMPDDHGMIFVFPDSQVRQFYMANTKIPLDIAFVGGNGDVVSVKAMQPMDLRITSSDSPAKYAIELNLGVAATVGLKVGDHLDLGNVPSVER